MNKEIIKFDDVSIGYGKNIIIKNISLSVYENDFIGIVGPNGAGKTTLLKTLLGSIKSLSGKIDKQNLRFGYVPQRDVVQPILPYSVFDVVLMGRYSLSGVFHLPDKKDKQIVNECLERVGILDLRFNSYKSLSGGQRQRTLIARALAAEPIVLILDEPTNGMDTPSHYILLDLISQLHKEKNLTIFLVSHLLSDVANVVKKVILLNGENTHFGNIDEVLSEENLSRTYSSNFFVTKINEEYLITSNHKG